MPKGVEVPLPLQAYFRINAENTGQFERTLIVVEEGAKVHYIEGCSAPIYAADSLHAAVVEVVALTGSKVRYTTIQNWSNDVYNLVTKRAHAYEELDRRVDRRQHRLAQDGQVPQHLPARPRCSGGHHQRRRGRQGPAPGHGRQGHPPRAGHRSRIVSKSVSKDGGRATYRGHLKVAPGATGVVASVRCDALMLDDQSRSDTYPYIDIAEDDTTMTHEATVGKISQDQVFYLMSRGLSENEAQNLIVQGFLEVFTKELPMEYAVEFNRLVKLEMEGALGLTAEPTPGNCGQVHRRPDSRLTTPEPDWMRAARHAALTARAAELPVESNQLFKTYVDLRSAKLDEIEPYLETGDAAQSFDGAARGSGRPHRDRRGPRRRPRAQRRGGARPASSSTRTMRGLRQRPGLLPKVSELVESGSSLPDDDKFAQLARALSVIGVLVHVPAGVQLDAPLVIRWSMGASGRGLITRTLVDLGNGAHATVLEEQVPSTSDDGRAARRCGGAPRRSGSATAPA